MDEMKRIFNKKFPNRLAALDKFLSVALLTLELVPVPTEEDMTETQIRDVNHTLSGDYDTGRVFEYLTDIRTAGISTFVSDSSLEI